MISHRVQSPINTQSGALSWIVRAELIGPGLLTLGATILWGASLKNVDYRSMTDLGLISVLPAGFFIALLMLTASFCLSLRHRRLIGLILLIQLVVLIFMLYGTTALVEEAPRFPTAYRMLGFAEYVGRTGRVDPTLDAYFNFPGFFILSSFVTQISGFESGLSLLAWAPVFFNLLYLGPLTMILNSIPRNRRLVWLGVWFFYITNWVGQDYLGPQALNYFLYLVIFGILLKWFKVSSLQFRASSKHHRARGLVSRVHRVLEGWLTPGEAPNTRSSPAQRAGLLAVILILFLVVVSSHPLTPFFSLAAVTTLVAFKRCSLRGLPVVMLVMIFTWHIFMAKPFLAGYLSGLIEGIGQVDDIYVANVIGRVRGSPEHVFVIYMRLVMTLALWCLALIGGIRRLRNGYRDLTYVLLAAAPFSLLVLLKYGGELLMRVYIFSLPFMVFFVAALFYTTTEAGTSWRKTGVIFLASVALLSGFLVSRYGNERMDNITFNEVNAVRYVHSVAEPGSLLVVPVRNLPWKFQDYEKFRYRALRTESLVGLVGEIAQIMGDTKYPESYLILTRGQMAYAELNAGLRPGSYERLEKDLAESGRFWEVFASDDAKVLVLARAAIGGEP